MACPQTFWRSTVCLKAPKMEDGRCGDGVAKVSESRERIRNSRGLG
jgi:hypothetical protein